MSATIIAASSASLSSTNTLRRKRECEEYLELFSNVPPKTVEEKQEFSQCVNIIYPDKMPEGDANILAILFLFSVVIGLGVGAKWWKEDGFGTGIVGIFAGMASVWVVVFLIGLVSVAILQLAENL